jgi:hypothetical protein
MSGAWLQVVSLLAVTQVVVGLDIGAGDAVGRTLLELLNAYAL